MTKSPWEGIHPTSYAIYAGPSSFQLTHISDTPNRISPVCHQSWQLLAWQLRASLRSWQRWLRQLRICFNAAGPSSVPGLGRSPGKGNGNPLRILAWRIPWTEEPGGLQFMGSQRVRHD